MKSSGKPHNLLDFAGYACPVEGLGPGRRAVIWVRGCTRRCPGCIAPELWAPGEPTPVAEIAAVLAPLLAEVDGLSISGGEPFDQPAALLALLDLLGDVETLVYSGCTREALTADGATAALLARIDLLIDGAFDDGAPNTRQWRGSDNQHVHLLSARAQQRYAGADETPMPDRRPLQVQMTGLTTYRIIGIPRRGDLAAYRELMAARGLCVRQDDGTQG